MSSVAVPPSDARQPLTTDNPARPVLEQLERSREMVVRTRLSITGLRTATFLLAMIGTMAIADYLWEISTTFRAIWLLASLVEAVLIARLLLKRWSWGFRTQDAAAGIESERQNVGQRFRTVVDYASPSVSPAPASNVLVRALSRETSQMVSYDDPQRLVAREPFASSVAWLAFVLAAWCIWLVWSNEHRTAAGRALLLPWEYTIVSFEPAKTTVRQGEDVPITLTIQGRPIPSAVVRYRPRLEGASWTELKAGVSPPSESDSSEDPAEQPFLTGTHTVTIDDCNVDTDFQVIGGPRDLPSGFIQVLKPLRVQKFTANAQPPEYTQRPPSRFETPQFQVLEGSRVTLEIQLNRAAREVNVTLVGSTGAEAERPPPILLQCVGSALRGTLEDLRRSVTFDVHARAADGVEMEPLRVEARVRPDALPTVRFLAPPEELEVVPTAEIRMLVEADDDLGLHKAGIAFQIGDGPLTTLWEQDFGGTAERVQGQEVLALEKYDVTFPGSVNYYAFAEDNYFGKPRRNVTPLRYVDIRPFKRTYQLLDCGGT